MKREFLITVSFCICKKTIKEPEGSALGFVVNYAPLSTWVRSVILSFRVVTRWAVSTPFSQVYLKYWVILELLCRWAPLPSLSVPFEELWGQNLSQPVTAHIYHYQGAAPVK